MSDDPARNDVPRMYQRWDGPDRKPETAREWVRWFRTVDLGLVVVIREILTSAAFVVGIALLLFGISGVWPPMVAVSSGSMQPNMHEGDLVLVADEHRYAGDAAVEGTGVVTYQSASPDGYTKFGDRGDVIVYRPDGSERRGEIIHRARFYVEEGENWYDRADPDHVPAENCEQLRNCPAPNSGFITKGDNGRTNQYYDQAQGMSRPVAPSWVEGKALVRVPFLGRLRLLLGSIAPATGSLHGGGLTGLGRGVAVAAGFALASTRLVVE